MLLSACCKTKIKSSTNQLEKGGSKVPQYLKVASNVFSGKPRNIHQFENFLGNSL